FARLLVLQRSSNDETVRFGEAREPRRVRTVPAAGRRPSRAGGLRRDDPAGDRQADESRSGNRRALHLAGSAGTEGLSAVGDVASDAAARRAIETLFHVDAEGGDRPA